LYAAKLRALAAEFERLGLSPPHTAAVDWTVGPGPVPGEFDRVLIDAPCTGVGTLRRRPEIAARLGPEDPARLGQLAACILRRAAARARVGGCVIFAVCSILPEEAEAVVECVADVLTPAPFDAPEIERLCVPGATSFRLLPSEHGTDGYFVASFVRTSSTD
jgi:16S rRNA (cytosine967-C5)-methyltransferase